VRITRVVSGGQSGADRAALDAALTLGLTYGGWCPAGGRAEDLPDPPGLLGRYPLLDETPPGSEATRTRWNVRDSDATLVLLLGDESSGGTRLTIEHATSLGRPCLVAEADDADRVSGWLGSFEEPIVLNVAGPRESEAPVLYAAAYRTLTTVLA
jgi:hypothetical protein